MKKSQQQQTKFRTVPLSEVPCFQGIAGKLQQAGPAQQPVADLPEFFKSVPGLAELFSKAQKQATGPDCSDCTDCTDYLTNLHQCRSAAFRVEVLAVLAADLFAKEADSNRIAAVLTEIENQARDMQLICGTAY